MKDYYHSLPLSERDRVEGLEVFDEFEELELKCLHYRLLCAASKRFSVLIEKLVPSSSHISVHTHKILKCSLEIPERSPDSVNLFRYHNYYIIVSLAL